jgi:ribosome-associated toxin RatA of RatAB toxin-antitoxin module
MADDTVRDSIDVEAGPDAVMDVIADFEAYPEWQPDITDVEILETDEDGWGTLVRFIVDARVFRATLVLSYTYTDTEMRWVLVEGEGVKRNDGVYLLEDLGGEATRVTYELTTEPSIPVPALLRRQGARKIVSGALKGMKRRVEDGA